MSHRVYGAARSEERVNHCPLPRSSSTNWETMRVKIYNQSLKPVMEGPQSTQRPCPGLPLRAHISELPVSPCFKGAAGILCAALPWHGSSSPALRFSPLPCARGKSLLSSCLFCFFFFFCKENFPPSCSVSLGAHYSSVIVRSGAELLPYRLVPACSGSAATSGALLPPATPSPVHTNPP